MKPTPGAPDHPHRPADPTLTGNAAVIAGLKAVPLFKTVSVSAFMALFFVGYFWALRHPAQPVVTMPVTPIDRWIPFTPWMGAAYYSLWLYLSLCAGFVPTARQLIVYGLYAAAIGLVGLTLFVVWPTAVPHAAIDWSLYPSIAFLKKVDASGNACPSLHVAYAVYSGLWLDQRLGSERVRPLWRVLNGAWCLAIVYSTIAIRQHVLIDVLVGAGLGALGAAAFLRARKAFRAA